MFKLTKKLNSEIINTTNTCHIGTINVSGINYYVKPDNEKKELIGFSLAKFYNLPSIPYYYLCIRGKYYAVSRDLKDLGNFIVAEQLLQEERDLTTIINKLRTFSFYSKELEKQIYQMYFFDFLFLNTDGYPRNYGFYKNGSTWGLVLFDHMNIFDILYPLAMRFNPINFIDNASISAYYKDLEDLLNVIPQDIEWEFKKMYETYTIEKVKEILNKLELQDVKLLMSIYEPHYNKIGEILNRGVKYAR